MESYFMGSFILCLIHWAYDYWWIGSCKNDFGVDGTATDCSVDCADSFSETNVERRRRKGRKKKIEKF